MLKMLPHQYTNLVFYEEKVKYYKNTLIHFGILYSAEDNY